MTIARYLGLMEVARETGIPYWRIIYAEQAGYLPTPMRIACKRVYSENHVQKIKTYFSPRRKRANAVR